MDVEASLNEGHQSVTDRVEPSVSVFSSFSRAVTAGEEPGILVVSFSCSSCTFVDVNSSYLDHGDTGKSVVTGNVVLYWFSCDVAKYGADDNTSCCDNRDAQSRSGDVSAHCLSLPGTVALVSHVHKALTSSPCLPRRVANWDSEKKAAAAHSPSAMQSFAIPKPVTFE